jgi:hypothetical protein
MSLGLKVPDSDLVPFIEKAARHRLTHQADANETKPFGRHHKPLS